jgi:hypothetical protein
MSDTGSVSISEEPVESDLPVSKYSANVKVTDAEAAQAARDCGMVGLRIKKVRAAARMGAFLDQEGVMKIARLYILRNIDKISDLQRDLEKDVDDCKDPEIRAQLRAVQKDLMANETHAIGTMMKSCVDKAVSDATAALVPMAEPRQQVTPQVVVNVNQPTPEPRQVVDLAP